MSTGLNRHISNNAHSNRRRLQAKPDQRADAVEWRTLLTSALLQISHQKSRKCAL